MIHVLLSQIGTIESLEKNSVRKYLRRFLSDDRIIDLPRIFWRPLLEIVIRIRENKVLGFYKDIWTPDGAPLYAISIKQQEALQRKLGQRYSVELFLSFTDKYSIEKVYTKLQKDSADKVILLPLFPQFSSATTSGIADTVFSKLLGWRSFQKKKKTHIPNIHFVSSFYNLDAYKAMYTAHIQKEITALETKPTTIIVSFHGLPVRYIKEGDVYQKHCEETFNHIKQSFSNDSVRFIFAYQSRFGTEKWLGPTTENTLIELAKNSPDTPVAVICPGFVTDCLETLSEINIELRHTYARHGGNEKKLFYIPCLNTKEEFIQFLAELVEKTASGFIK